MADVQRGDESTRTHSQGAEQRAARAASTLDAKLSGPLAPLEKALDDVLVKNAPYQLPQNARDTIVRFAPWISLLSGLFGLFSAYSLWRLAHTVNAWVDYANQLSVSMGGTAQVQTLGLTFWLSLIMLLVFAGLAFMAFPGLKAHKKTGWNFMFYSLIISVIYSVVSLFYDGGGFSSFLGSAIGSVLGLYLLFQVRSHYKA